MNDFTKEFFEKHNIDLKFVIDAEEQVISDSFVNIMRNQNKYFAYNTTKCEKGHDIRSRSKHCLVCNTYDIKIYKDLYDPGFVYIAGSKRKKIVKIGSSRDNWTIVKRQNYLNEKKGYAETNDWKILYSFYCDQRGFHEKEIHKILKPYHANGFVYQKEDITNSTEIYYCSYKKAFDICDEYFNDKEIRKNMIEKNFDEYQFPNLKKT